VPQQKQQPQQYNQAALSQSINNNAYNRNVVVPRAETRPQQQFIQTKKATEYNADKQFKQSFQKQRQSYDQVAEEQTMQSMSKQGT
jgi:hypothetical protein